ncbi:MAG: AraC family transcriptional regulator [Lysobacterales bacterium 63-13]|nr:MAG: AraC family transcriptional regulator [Xanthomonadales bacterium 63-13]
MKRIDSSRGIVVMGTVDRLSALLEQFRVQAHLFHAGPLCGLSHFDAQPGRGFLHVLRRGELVVTHAAHGEVPERIPLHEPTLLFYPRPLAHAFENPPLDGADFVCATVDFQGRGSHPLLRALPPLLVLPLREVDGLEQTLALLFAETERVRCGQRLLASRLFDVLVLQLLRWLLDHPEQARLPVGMLAGLADPRLARILTGFHEQPGRDWNLQSMAQTAGMSRSAFAACFKQCVGSTPAAYLQDWRITLAQSLLINGTSIKAASHQLGFSSAAGLSRAFTQTLGVSPRHWLQALA